MLKYFICLIIMMNMSCSTNQSENILNVIRSNNPTNAFIEASKLSDKYDAIIVTGSFELVGPAIEWLES